MYLSAPFDLSTLFILPEIRLVLALVLLTDVLLSVVLSLPSSSSLCDVFFPPFSIPRLVLIVTQASTHEHYNDQDRHLVKATAIKRWYCFTGGVVALNDWVKGILYLLCFHQYWA